MGFFDALFGRTRVPPGKADPLFALSTALLDIEAKLNAKPGPESALVLRMVDNSEYEALEREVEATLKVGGKDLPVEVRSVEDNLGYRWMVFAGPDPEQQLNAIYLASDLLKEGGYADGLLAALFKFQPRDWYLIYSFRRAAFYPFVPLPGNRRDQPREFRLGQTLKAWLPIEKDPERWYALWDPPL
ncbi:MAG: hypothetical protein K6U14_00075 [Firmicutes bacterium]|nr:hypothetical protein [Alicyclobacillaceae bacterium]MCL6496020.1 hypothetical protein [Bacillota bacterium]